MLGSVNQLIIYYCARKDMNTFLLLMSGLCYYNMKSNDALLVTNHFFHVFPVRHLLFLVPSLPIYTGSPRTQRQI